MLVAWCDFQPLSILLWTTAPDHCALAKSAHLEEWYDQTYTRHYKDPFLFLTTTMDFADPPIMSSGNFDPFEQEHRDSAMPRDLGLDPSDPLNLLLNNSSQDSSMEDSSSSHGSPPDWSQLSSSFWPNQGENMKPYPALGMDFLQMDMDFNPSMAVDPNS